MGNRHPTIVPYETFAASDGDFVVAVGNDALWRAFCRACGLEALGEDPRFATNPQRVDAYDEIVPVIAERLQDADARRVDCGARRRRRAVRRRARRRRSARRIRSSPRGT